MNQNAHQRYYEYILNIIEVGEVVKVGQIHSRLYDFNPNLSKGLIGRRSFKHSNMPTTRGIGGMLRGKKEFEKLKNGYWRRIE